MNINKVLIAGRLTREPEITRRNDTVTARYTLAVNIGENTEYIPCLSFGKQAELAEQYLHQGKELLVIGWLHIKRAEESGRILYVKILVKEQHFGKGSNTFHPSREAAPFLEDMEGEMPFC